MTSMRSLFVLALLGAQGVLAAEKEPQLETPGLRQRAEDLARAASQRFTDIIDNAKQQLTQGAAQQPQAEKRIGEERPLAPVWDWLHRSAQSYDDAIVAQLKNKDGRTTIGHQEGKPQTAPDALPELRGWNGLLELVRYWLVRANSAYRNEIVAPLRLPGASKGPIEQAPQTAVASASGVAPSAPVAPDSPEKQRPKPERVEREAKAAESQRRAEEKRLANAAEKKRRAQAEARARLIEEAETRRRADDKKRAAAAAEARRLAEEAKREAEEADAAERRAVAEAEAEAKRKAEIEAEATRRSEVAARAKALARAAKTGSSAAQAPTAAAVPGAAADEPPAPSLPQSAGAASRASGIAGEKSVVAVAPPAEGKKADAGQRTALASEARKAATIAETPTKARTSPKWKSEAASAAPRRHKAHAHGKWRRPHVRKHRVWDGGAGYRIRRCDCPCHHGLGRKARRHNAIAPASWRPWASVHRHRAVPVKYHRGRVTYRHRVHYIE